MTTEASVAKTPLFTQPHLRGFLMGAHGIRDEGELADRISRNLTRAERQLLAIAGVVCEIIAGTLGEDDDGPIGDLKLKAQPYVRATYQPKLSGGNGKK